MRPRDAWLISWNSKMGSKLVEDVVVATLSSRLNSTRVKYAVAAIWCSRPEVALCDRVYRGLKKVDLVNDFLSQDGNHFFYPSDLKPRLYARKVTCMRWERIDNRTSLTWNETPIVIHNADSGLVKENPGPHGCAYSEEISF